MPKPSSKFCMRLGLLGVLLGALVLPLTTLALGSSVPLYVSEELDDKSALVPLSPQTKALFDYLEGALQFQFEIRRVPWKRAVESAQNGEGMIFGISKTQERLRQLASPYLSILSKPCSLLAVKAIFVLNPCMILREKL